MIDKKILWTKSHTAITDLMKKTKFRDLFMETEVEHKYR